jgi:hypothetical protein
VIGRASRHFLTHLFVLLVLATLMWAKGNPDITQFGHDIRVEPGQKVGDVTCFNCSIYVRGEATSDLTAFHGDIFIGENAVVAGDVTDFLGDARLANGAKISGDVTVFGGMLHRQPGAMVSGDVTTFENKFLVFLMLLSPLVVVAAIVALIVWLVRRNRRRTGVPVASGGLR